MANAHDHCFELLKLTNKIMVAVTATFLGLGFRAVILIVLHYLKKEFDTEQVCKSELKI